MNPRVISSFVRTSVRTAIITVQRTHAHAHAHAQCNQAISCVSLAGIDLLCHAWLCYMGHAEPHGHSWCCEKLSRCSMYPSSTHDSDIECMTSICMLCLLRITVYIVS